jgi:putative addiction module killer protein
VDRKLKDRAGRLRILKRTTGSRSPTPATSKPVGNGASELRLDVGPGYRVYCLQDGDVLTLLLCSGDKSAQRKDIDRAQRLADEWRADMKNDGGDEQQE